MSFWEFADKHSAGLGFLAFMVVVGSFALAPMALHFVEVIIVRRRSR